MAHQVREIPHGIAVHPPELSSLDFNGRSYVGCVATIIDPFGKYHVFPANPTSVGYTLIRDRDRRAFRLARSINASAFLKCTELFGRTEFRDNGRAGLRLAMSWPVKVVVTDRK